MDAVVFIIFAWVLVFMQMKNPQGSVTQMSNGVEVQPEDVTRTTKLNDAFYDDPNAFTEISRALGF